MKFKFGDKVTWNGSRNAVYIRPYTWSMCEVVFQRSEIATAIVAYSMLKKGWRKKG